MGAKFLSLTGLTQYDTKIKEYISTAVIENSPIIVGDADHSAVLKGEYEGYSNKAISQTSMAVGAATTAGLKGWYYSKIEFGSTPIITLSDKQPSVILGYLRGGEWSSGTPNIKVGDKVSIVNNAKYDYCGEVKSISENKVTLKSALPFDSLDTGLISLNNPDDWSIYLPDNESAGIIDFGGGALAEGVNTKATNIGSHAEGIQTHAYGQYSHTEGFKTEAGYAAHAEGKETIASGQCSHTEGQENTSAGNVSHTEGRGNYAQSSRGHAEGENNYVGNTDRTTPEPTNTTNKGFAAHAEGQANTVLGNSAHAEGIQNKANGLASHAEGESTTANGQAAHAEGIGTNAVGQAAHTEGTGTSTGYTLDGTTYAGTNSHAEGENTIAARGSHAEGTDTKAYGWQSHAEGKNTIASANFAHTEGEGTTASASRTHAEGYSTKAISQAAHSEGINTIAGKSVDENGNIVKPTVSTNTTEGYFSHAEGNGTLAYGNSSHAEGKGTITNNIAEHASGLYNLSTTKTSDNTPADATQFSIGIGTKNERKNAFEVKQNGDIYIKGIGDFTGDNSDESTNLADAINNLDKKVNTGGQITSNIQIAGGPLANDILDTDYWPEDWYETPKDKTTVRIIPANTSFEDIIRTLFLQELPGTVSWSPISWSPSVGQPSVTLSSSGSLEVGTRITIKSTTAGTVSNNSRSSTCSASYGYFLADSEGKPTGSHIKNTTLTKTKNGRSDNKVSYTYTWNGSAVNAGDEMQVKENTNTLTVSQSGPTVNVEALPTTKVFASTNTKKVLDKVHATLLDTKPSNKLLSNSKNYTITGVRYAFTGAVASGFKYDSTYIRTNLIKNGYAKGSVTSLKAPAGNTQVIIAFPRTWGSLTKVIDNNALNAIITNEFKLTDNIPVYGDNGFKAVNYKVYVYTSNVVLGEINYTISIN